MNLVSSNDEIFTNKHMTQAFYPSNGEIFTGQKDAFKLNNSIQSISLKEDSKLPLYIFFGEIKINDSKSAITSNGI